MDIPQWWSWLLASIGLLGIWLTGSRRRVGFLLGVGAQVLWLAYAITTGQWGFIATAIAYAVVYGRGWLAWGRPSPEAK